MELIQTVLTTDSLNEGFEASISAGVNPKITLKETPKDDTITFRFHSNEDLYDFLTSAQRMVYSVIHK